MTEPHAHVYRETREVRLQRPGRMPMTSASQQRGATMYDHIEKTYVLYRWFDEDDILLYVGITDNPGVRFKEHQRQTTWFATAVTCTLERFPSREELKAAELKAIRDENPIHNHVAKPNGTPPPRASSKKIPNEGNRGRPVMSVFGADASAFQAPDAIADE